MNSILSVSALLFVLLLFFQNCGSNSNSTSNISPSSDLPTSNPFPSDLDNSGQRKVCTSAPTINVIGHWYGTTDGALSFTRPILWTINTTNYSSTHNVYSPQYKSCGRNCIQGQLDGFYFKGIDIHTDGTPVTFGKERLVRRTTDCYYKSFSWLGNQYSELLFPSVPEFSTPNMVPLETGQVLMVNDQAHLAMTFRHTNDPYGCSLTQAGTYVDALVPAVYNLNTKKLDIYESTPHSTPYSSERIHDLVETNGVIYASGSNSQNAVFWRNGKLNILPNQENRRVTGTPFIEKSMNMIYIAFIDFDINSSSFIIWENGSVGNLKDVPKGTSLIAFSAESKSTYALLKNGSSYYYVKNGTDRFELDTTGFTSCIASDIKAFNGKVYALGYCANAATKQHVIWEDGQIKPTTLFGSSNVQNPSEAKFNLGCQTASGYTTELD